MSNATDRCQVARCRAERVVRVYLDRQTVAYVCVPHGEKLGDVKTEPTPYSVIRWVTVDPERAAGWRLVIPFDGKRPVLREPDPSEGIVVLDAATLEDAIPSTERATFDTSAYPSDRFDDEAYRRGTGR